MRLLKIHVEGFGVLQNYRLELADGLNVLHQRNGWGKSTLAVFIKAMLYGLPATTKRSLDDNERKKYTPWQGGVYGGSLEFECTKGRFRIERFFAEKEAGDSFALFDLSTNKLSDAFSDRVGEELFGIDADGFERSTYLSQRQSFERSENTSIRTKLGDLLDDVNDMGNYDNAIEILDKRRKFYQMTGNRGAIAQEERRLSDLRAELELCLRAENSANQLREELRACNAEIVGAEGEERALLAKRELVIKARERVAQMEEKGRMLAALADISNRRKLAEEELCGIIPSDEEIAASQTLLHELHDVKAALNTIPTVSPDAEELEDLQALFANGIPSAEEMDAYQGANDRLIRLREKQERMRTDLEEMTPDPRFMSGIPTPEEFERQFAMLSESEQLRAEITREEQERVHRIETATRKKRRNFLVGITSAVVGAVCMGASFLFSGAAMTAMLIGGGVLSLMGAILILHSVRKRPEDADGLAEKRHACAEMHGAVEAFLQHYAMPTEGDRSRLLTELSLVAVQNREKARRRRILRDQLTEVLHAAEHTCKKMEGYLHRFDPDCTEESFGQTLTSLRRDVERYRLLLREDARRRAQRRAAEEEKGTLEAKLRPFLKRYDPMSQREAEDVVADVSESANTYRELTREYKRRETALRDFIAEKQLDRPLSEEEIDHKDLVREETSIKARLEELRGQRTRLHMEIERLADDTDRIPELEAAVTSTDERIKIYKKNNATIKATQLLLTEAKEGLSTRYLSGMQESFLQYLSDLTGDKLPESVLDSSFDVSVRAFGKSRSMESFSRGMRDAVRFCVRLSLTEELSKESEVPFLLLDDPFVNLDEEHLEAVRGLLARLASRYQILHMICHEGRA